ncbi:MAG: AmmeMemoRadiSam system protein B [Spirochaetales bacterium]|nr:AmmeMemoRadiSam system protein B [Spirochaetales bacterium]
MDKLRKAYFSGSWYPDRKEDVLQQIEEYNRKLGPAEESALSVIVPHAGWYFSGHLAYDAVRRIKTDVQVVFILGGHLPDNQPFLFWSGDHCETPLGSLEIHRGLRDSFMKDLNAQFDNSPDNTIEVQLPFIRSHFGNIPIVPLRVPAGPSALLFPDTVQEILLKSNLKAAFIGSTDLTHYGPNYGFAPEDSLENPRKWVEDSDRKILEAMKTFSGADILRYGSDDSSACSAGAAAAASLLGRISGSVQGRLLWYETSLTRHQSSSFVGYGSLIFPC